MPLRRYSETEVHRGALFIIAMLVALLIVVVGARIALDVDAASKKTDALKLALEYKTSDRFTAKQAAPELAKAEIKTEWLAALTIKFCRSKAHTTSEFCLRDWLGEVQAVDENPRPAALDSEKEKTDDVPESESQVFRFGGQAPLHTDRRGQCCCDGEAAAVFRRLPGRRQRGEQVVFKMDAAG